MGSNGILTDYFTKWQVRKTIFPGVQGYRAEISESSFQHRKLWATWGSTGLAAQLARCSERYLRGQGVPFPSSRSGRRGGRKDQLSISALRIDRLNVWFALMQTKSKLSAFELVALSFPDFCRASKSAKKTASSSSISISPCPSLSVLTPPRLKNKHHIFIKLRDRDVCPSAASRETRPPSACLPGST